MHECPDCGQACSCDMEDIWNDAAADECEHACDRNDLEDDEGDEPDWLDRPCPGCDGWGCGGCNWTGWE